MRVIGGWMLGVLLLAQPALAQKPGAAPPAAPALPTVKPPPLGATPPPAATPPRAQAPATTAPTPSAPPLVLAPPPADEPPAVRRLRAVFPPDTQIAYRTATVIDEASQRVRLQGVTMQRPGSTVTVDEALVEGLSEAGLREADLRGIVVTSSGTTVGIARLRLTGLAAPRAPGAAEPRPEDVALDRLMVEGLRVDNGADGVVTLAGFTVEELGGQRRTRVRLEGLAGERLGAEAVSFTLARAALSGIDVMTMAFEMQSTGVPRAQTGRMELFAEGFTFSQRGRAAGGAESLRIESDTDATQSGTGRLALRGMRFDGIPEVAAAIQQLGYQALAADITLEATLQAAGGRLGVPALVLSIPEYGRLTFSGEFDGMVPGAPPERMMTDGRLISLALRYRDEGLLARAIRAQAASQRITEAQFREQLIGMARGAAGGPAQAVLREPLERFLRGQATELELTARPPQPIAFGALGTTPPRDAADAQRRFGLTATAR
ncbi:MAG: hypothetical protein V4653_15130 [Pseudomonadota bacterium]